MNYAVYKTRVDIEKKKFVAEVIAVFTSESDAQAFVDAINPKIIPDFAKVIRITPWE